MFIKFLVKKITFLFKQNQTPPIETQSAEKKTKGLSDKLKDNIDSLKLIFGDSGDLKIHEILFGKNLELSGALIFIDGLVDSKTITESIIKPLILNKNIGDGMEIENMSMDIIKKTILCSGDMSEIKDQTQMIEGCLAGETVFLLDGFKEALLISTKGWEKRNVTEPQTELVVRGPREGFTEDFRTNTALLRRRIKSPDFKMEQMKIGRKSLTDVCIAYIDKVAQPRIIEMVKKRLEKLEVDSILDSGYIEEYIEDAPFSVFPTVGYSEKPDVIAGKLLEGRVAIIVDGSPFVLTAPYLFIESFQTSEDYCIRPLYASVTRMLRLMAYFISIFTVPIYIALTTFHQELIPTTLLFTFANASEGTPFPSFIEALIMVFSFEILREAGLRLPRPVGQAISIVGALIMGDAAVAAGLVGAPMVIAVAFTAVAGFVIPVQIDSVSILRFILMVFSAALGGFGIAIGLLGILVHLASLKSFGVDYFGTVIPSQDLQDSFVRMPLWSMSGRPKDIAYIDKKRRKTFIPSTRRSNDHQET
ncbi:MAG: spore germination protein [Oscillospiraceae bacterium]|jgi:spore germination protein KA|nr:spore germination protein [Oscillospiraceae bacterium]